MFFVYCILFLIFLYKYFSTLFNKHFIAISFLIKSLFIFVISSYLHQSRHLKIPDEEHYFHDAVVFNHLAKEHPMYYLQFLFDIETTNDEIFTKYYSATDAWYKSPEFFYNDNRWVVKVHSILAFLSGYNLSVHRLFSAIMSIFGLLFIFNFFLKCFNVTNTSVGWIFLISSLSPAFFFFTSFVLKESIMIFLIGCLLSVLQQWIYNNYNIQTILITLIIIYLAMLFRPAYLIPLIYLSMIYFLIKKYTISHQVLKYITLLIITSITIYFTFQLIFKKSILDIVQYRQERFLDGSRGGIFLINPKKFVRVPYDWNNLKCDSSSKPFNYYIKKDVKIMYWYFPNLNDTIVENNKDTSEAYKFLYSIEKANRTIYINPINSQKSLIYNIKSIIQAIHVFFFYPKKINNLMDMGVWVENIMIPLLLITCLIHFFKNQYPLEISFILTFCVYIILIISITSPNTGAIIRYRYFLIPILYTTSSLLSLKRSKES